MKRYIIALIAAAISAFAAFASDEMMPSWAINTPNPPAGANWFLNWGVGVGSSEEAARNKAWADALTKSLHELRAVGITKQDINAVANNGIDAVVSFNQVKRRIIASTTPIVLDNGKKKVYILIQVQRNVNGANDFYSINTDKYADRAFNRRVEDYNARISGNYPFSARVFVPGMAQIHKGSVTKGAIIIGAEAICVGGIIASECLRSSYASKVNSTHSAENKLTYHNKATNCRNARNVFIAAAAAVYVWNVVDGIVAKGKRRSTYYSLAPCIGVDNYGDNYGGLALTITF